jgi:hypothetical protein
MCSSFGSRDKLSLCRSTLALFGVFQPPQSLIDGFQGARCHRRDQANRHERAIAKYDSQIRRVSEKAQVNNMVDRASNAPDPLSARALRFEKRQHGSKLGRQPSTKRPAVAINMNLKWFCMILRSFHDSGSEEANVG